jgi:hypothetical protein
MMCVNCMYCTCVRLYTGRQQFQAVHILATTRYVYSCTASTVLSKKTGPGGTQAGVHQHTIIPILYHTALSFPLYTD